MKPLLLAGAAVICVTGAAQPAWADPAPSFCTVTGDISEVDCDSGNVEYTANSGDSSLDVTGADITTGNINYNPHPDAEGPLGMSLTVNDTTVNSTTYGGININSFVEDTTIDVTLGDDVEITSNAGFGGVWVRNNESGDITIISGATVEAGTPDPNGAAITATSNGGSVSITNTGNVTGTNNRGIYADGSGEVDDFASVYVNNSGTVDADQAGIRGVGYYANVSIENTGDVTSAQKQALVAWSQTGDVDITSSGHLTATADAGIRGSADKGDTTIINNGNIDAYQGINADAGYYDEVGGYGDVSVTNTSRITATGSEAIYAFARDGEIEIDNSGDVTGATDGISADSLDGSVTITNTATVRGVNGIRTGAADATITNSGTIATTGSGSAVIVGSGDTTLILEEGSVLAGKLTIGTGSLAIDPSLDTSLSNVVAGEGTLIKQGDAQLTLTGDSSAYAGDLRVEEGVLKLTGQLGADRVYVGSAAGAELEISGGPGATLTSSHVVIGHYEGETGEATVSGTGNSWTSTGNIYVGNEGDGSLSVLSGATVASVDGYVGTVDGSHGEVTIDGADSEWAMSGVFIAGHQNGTTADVTISNGGSLKAVQGTLGDLAGSHGSMTVTGEGSVWSAYDDGVTDYAGFMNVGRFGEGELTVSDGGAVEAYRLYIGNEEGSVGSVVVTGEGSSITTGHRIYVGSYGSGSLTVADGAQVTAERINIAYLEGSSGVLNIGAAEGEEAVGAGALNTPKIYIGMDNGQLVFNHTDTDYELASAISGTGEIRHLAGHSTLTGDSSAYTGDVIVTGGVLALTGQLGSTNAIVGGEAGASVLVSGEDALWVNTTDFDIGQEGTGDVTVSGGARVETYSTHIGAEDGTLILEGEGSHWFNQLHTEIGRAEGSSGTLIVRDGGVFETSGGGLYAGEGADITITGAGSKMLIGTLHPELPANWDAADGWFSLDEGKALVSEGGLLQADGIYIGGDGDTVANVTVTGEGTRMVSQLSLYVGGTGNGNEGHGMLTIADGAKASAYTTAAGVDEGSVGTILVTGAGSSLESLSREGYSGNLRAGFNGDGTIIVQDGGLVKAANIIDIATNETATGRLVIGAAEGEHAVAAGTVQAANGIFFGAGDAQLVFNHTSNITFDNVMFGTGGEIRHLSGVTNLTADSPDYFGSIDVLGGLLKANGNLSGADVTIGDGGTLGGAGTIGSVVVGDGGILAPGNSPGQLTIVGDVLFESGSTYDVEIDGLLHDSILVQTGDVTIEEGALLNAAFAPGVLLDNPYQVIVLADGSDGEFIVEGDGFVLPTEDNPLLEGLIGYSADGITVTYQGIKTEWAKLVGTANQGATASAVQALGGTNSLYYRAMFLKQSDLGTTFDNLSGEIHASLKSALIDESRILRGVAMDRAAELGEGTGLWATAFGNWGSLEGDGNAAELESDSAGAFMGIDAQLGDWRLGVLGGYNSSNFDVDARASTAESETFHLGAYVGGAIGQFRMRAAFGQSWHDMSTERGVVFPTTQRLSADYNGTTTQLFGEIGYAVKVGGVDVEPFAGLAYVSLKTDDYAETGGVAALTGDSMSTDATFGTFGFRGSAKLDVAEAGALIKGLVGWRHAFGDTLPYASHSFGAAAAPFTVTGVPVAEDAMVTEVSVDFPLNENVRLNLGYKGQFGGDVTDNSARGGIVVRF
ncbi:autotransporter domain-containing protein [Altererythrobacter sp. CC-YST694]|uniref:autotransporter domain-containing protein n=1 Tax=Altererythrobacter sp. CC-YST694 TaxID=2755038 RepID=UPI001D0196B2|nr:autotransporter domain-containing protein [Altererythrobacter sp. CC-YST694]MCB5425861.1 autotransporter domain-containing protein [Altererythrobacter sp. CC-YST694]